MNKNLTSIINAKTFDKYLVRGNEIFIISTRKWILLGLREYLGRLRTTFYKHCTTETEINIKNNNIDDVWKY